MRAEHRNCVGFRAWVAGHRGKAEGCDVVDQTEQRGAGGARDVLLGDVEQCRDGVEVAIGLRSGGTAAFAGGQPAPLQT